MITHPVTTGSARPSWIEFLISGTQQDFPIVDDDVVVGILTRADLLTALAQQGEQVVVSDVMQRFLKTADGGEH